MRLSANHVTLARLFLLPLPVAMLYRGTTGWTLAALGIFILLGLTDAVDGMLARRYGGTPLGALLDPLVDKIFLVATYGPLADLGILPEWLVIVLFVRELGVTALRSIALDENVTFRTSRIAKLKTTVQMAGAGFIILYYLFPDPPEIRWIQWAGIIGCLIPVFVRLARGQRPGWRSRSGAVLITAVCVLPWFLDEEGRLLAIAGVILALTVYSGAEYFWSMRHVLARRFRRSPLEAVRLAAVSLVIPLTYLPAMQLDGAPIWGILLLLAVELAIGGLDNSLVQDGVRRGPAADLARSAVQAVAGVGMLAMLRADPPATTAAHVFCGVALAVSLVDLFVRAWRHRDVLIGSR